MEMLVGLDWRDFFDVVIVNANKPKFFTEVSRPIRVFDKNANTHIWEKVTSLEKGIIYYEVHIYDILILMNATTAYWKYSLEVELALIFSTICYLVCFFNFCVQHTHTYHHVSFFRQRLLCFTCCCPDIYIHPHDYIFRVQ